MHFNISRKLEYSTYRVLNKHPKQVEMEYSILTLTARDFFLKFAKYLWKTFFICKKVQ